ncbi:YkgJ family cysteine cluster protein [Halalkalibacter alkaliphilus]|uniref:YkgJ family cysteine cluster protein n=1 Tax=Halalkalibacter alkaliphilus TaxID=2917993 RepID=A0A9X2I7I6_9BACI|nr:YkgJ family cysteine cluster protein [Halalkalibacter alkaliphilus]MCL7749213.1 YkgJ family cysteine cluster protein [Halalkalibacter alkaliphilus]
MNQEFIKDDTKFPCDSCGLCCTNIQMIEELQEFNRGDGTCKHLVNNQCDIYESRPLVCRIDDMYMRFYQHTYSKEEFYLANIEVCKELQNNNNEVE